MKCAFHENIHTHPKEGHLKFLGGGESQKPNFLKESMKLNWKVLGGGGFKPKNLPWGGMDIFWNHTITVKSFKTLTLKTDHDKKCTYQIDIA